MEDLCERIPLIYKFVFSNLDDKSLANCREASRRLKESLDKERLLWLRIIKLNSIHFNEHSKLWKKAVEKTPVEILKYLAIAIDQFFNWTSSEYKVPSPLNIDIGDHRQSYRYISNHRAKMQWSPHHIAAKSGNLQLYQHIAEKTTEINPSGCGKMTALHFASTNVHLGVSKFIMDNLVNKNPSDIYGQTPFH